MDKIQIIGGAPLEGVIKISGSKNSALPILAATLLANEEFIINNIPDLTDVDSMIKLLESFNAKIKYKKNSCFVNVGVPNSLNASYELVRKMRASFLILGPLLAKYGYVEVSMPGGCAIGTRPVDLHLEGLSKMGAKFDIKDGYVKANTKGRLKGAEINLKKTSVGATENLMIAACLADGVTRINNAAREPEVVDLGDFLKKMGATISGLGTKRIVIQGKKNLNGCNYTVMPDRIEAGTFALGVLGCSGELFLENVNGQICDHLKRIFSMIDLIDLKTLNGKKKLRVTKLKKKELSLKVKTSVYPGFPTDLQAQLIAALTKSKGESEIKENIFENRFMHISELKRMGADLKLNGSKVVVKGVEEIFGAEVMATDLRASSSLIIAGLMASGKTIINRVYHLDRGYEKIEKKLTSCGAMIDRI